MRVTLSLWIQSIMYESVGKFASTGQDLTEEESDYWF